MSHRPNRNNITPRRKPDSAAAMTGALDQLAASIAERRGEPHLAVLEPTVASLVAKYRELCGHLDPVAAGAVMMFLGQVFTAHVNGQASQEGQALASAQLPDIARLAGAALYTGSNLPIEATCPFRWSSGNACGKQFTAPTRERLDVLLGAHVWQHHPGEAWPPGDAADLTSADEEQTSQGWAPPVVWLIADNETALSVYASAQSAREAATEMWVQREADGAGVTEWQARSKAFSWRETADGVEQLIVNGVGEYLTVRRVEVAGGVSS